jgi:hypothetical protein
MQPIVRFYVYRGVRYTAAHKAMPAHFSTCGTCGRSWDDTKSTGLTPTPSGRCPFEYFKGHSNPA